MELFQRVRELKKIAGSLDSLAKSMGIAPQQLSAYSNVKSQKNFFEYLPKILECYPNVRREWLYWGEEPMLKSEVSNPELDSP